MEIELLSKMLREVLPERETVSLPGLGEFVSVQMPASFSDRGRTITPPYVKISFLPTTSNDRVLVDMYAAGNNIDTAAAETIVLGYLRELRDTLEADGTVVFPSLGTLRRTRRGDFLFIQDDDLDIFPELFGLQPISLRTGIPDSSLIPSEPVRPESASDSPGVPSDSVRPEPATDLLFMGAKVGPVAAPALPSSSGTAESCDGSASEAIYEPMNMSEEAPSGESEAGPSESTTEPIDIFDGATVNNAEGDAAETIDGPMNVTDGATVDKAEGDAAETIDGPMNMTGGATVDKAEGDAPEAIYEPMNMSEGALSEGNETVVPEKTNRKTRSIWPAVLITVAALAMGLALFACLGRLAPEVVDRILYSAEDYKILHP